MDLIRLLRSLEEFLYELIGWFVFYPRTMWRIAFHPGATALYARVELTKAVDTQFQDTISPVLMLVLSVVVAHVLELAVNIPLPTATSTARQFLFGSEQGLLLTRSAVFCIFALGASLGTLRRQKVAVTRDSLREPFAIQALLVSPFIVLLSIALIVVRTNTGPQQFIGFSIAAIAVAWYVFARTAAFHALYGGSWLRPLISVCVWFALTSFAILLMLALLVP